MKTKFKIILFILSFAILNSSVYGADVINITPKDLQNINFEISPKVPLSNGEITGDLKILKDLKITSSVKDFNDSNKILLNLTNPLNTNSSYNLLSVFGVDGNIDFIVGSELKLLDIKNTANVLGIQGISRLLILDSRTIEVYFNEPISTTEFEFKLFRETLVNKITNSGAILSINLKENLDKSSNYILMMISLSNKFGIDVQFKQEIYDFVTSAILGDKIAKVDKNPTSILKRSLKINNTGSGELASVALNSAVTPDTGPETWILIFLTLIVNIFLIVRKKIIK